MTKKEWLKLKNTGSKFRGQTYNRMVKAHNRMPKQYIPESLQKQLFPFLIILVAVLAIKLAIT